jgi:hypothetical protein
MEFGDQHSIQGHQPGSDDNLAYRTIAGKFTESFGSIRFGQEALMITQAAAER